jgi:hypothetical protein
MLVQIHRGAGLVTLFAALLAGCSDRTVPEGEGGGTEGGTGGSTDGSTSDPSPTTATSSTSSTGTTDSTGTSTTTTTTGEPVTTTSPSSFTSDDQPVCVYEDHDIVLTPEEYDAWLHGMGVGETEGDSETGAGTTAGTTGADTTGTDTGETTAGEPWSYELCVKICDALTEASPWDITSCEQTGVDADGNILIECVQIIEHCDGRSHACIASRGAVALEDPFVAHFARAAHDEAASVHAFAALAVELAALGAPPELLAQIQSATADEVRHAEAVARLVAEHGGRCRPPARRPHTARQAREIAIENAVEGCVRETWAALLAAHQAGHAEDPRVRAVMRPIAADEARHAELAWAIDAWLCGLLDPAARAEVDAARHSAATALLVGVAAREPAPALIREAGLPGREQATRLAQGLAATLWAA